MIWRRHRTKNGPPSDAADAATQAARALEDAKNFGRRVDRVTAELTETRRRNNFGAAVADSMRGGRS